MVTHLPCMLPQKLLQIHLKGSVLGIEFPKMKPFLTRVAMIKLLKMILKHSDNYNSGDICVGRIIELGKSDNGGNRKAILNTDHFEGVYPIIYLRFLECQPKSYDKVDQQITPNVQSRPRIQAVKVANIYLFSILIIFKHCNMIVVLSLSFLEKEFPLKTQPCLDV